jgi:hypothetical protein
MLTLVVGQGINTIKVPSRQVEKSHNNTHSFVKLIYTNKNTCRRRKKQSLTICRPFVYNALIWWIIIIASGVQLVKVKLYFALLSTGCVQFLLHLVSYVFLPFKMLIARL